MIDLNEMAKASYGAIERREANGAVGISTDSWRMLEHMASEVVETAGAFHSYLDHLDEPAYEDLVASELADVIICCLAFAGQRGIDIDFALRTKMNITNKEQTSKETNYE